MAKHLNQVIAVEKGIKARVYAEITELHKASQNAALFDGHNKVYTPKDEDGEVLPPQTKTVQMSADDVFDSVKRSLTELFDVVATKDWANCTAKASVMIDGTALLEDVPATYLLFLDKQLGDLNKFVSAFVELDTSVEWTKETSSGVYKSSVVKTQRTEKVHKPIVLYDATKEHPAQTQMIVQDVTVGYWDTTRMSGALPKATKRQLLERIRRLMHAVKEALEKANTVDAPSIKVGETVMAYLFSDLR